MDKYIKIHRQTAKLVGNARTEKEFEEARSLQELVENLDWFQCSVVDHIRLCGLDVPENLRYTRT